MRVGVIGCGQVAAVGHFPWYRANTEVDLVAAADPERKKLNLARKLFGVRELYDDPLEMINGAGLDAVSICSPHWVHAYQAEASLEAGLHVLCEKPMAVNTEDCLRMVDASDRADTIFQVAHQKRYQWAYQRIREEILEGRLGEVYQVGVEWHHYVPDLESPAMKRVIGFTRKLGVDPARDLGAWRQSDPRTGGGDLMDHGPHYFDLVRFWLGEVKTLSAEIGTVTGDRIYEDHADIVVRFENGAIGFFERSDTLIGRPTGHETGHIYGTKGRLSFRTPFEYTNRPARLYRYTFRNIPLNRYTRIRKPRGIPGSPYRRQIDHFISRITEQRAEESGFPSDLAATARDGMAAIEMVLAAYRSSRDGIKVELNQNMS